MRQRGDAHARASKNQQDYQKRAGFFSRAGVTTGRRLLAQVMPH